MKKTLTSILTALTLSVPYTAHATSKLPPLRIDSEETIPTKNTRTEQCGLIPRLAGTHCEEAPEYTVKHVWQKDLGYELTGLDFKKGLKGKDNRLSFYFIGGDWQDEFEAYKIGFLVEKTLYSIRLRPDLEKEAQIEADIRLGIGGEVMGVTETDELEILGQQLDLPGMRIAAGVVGEMSLNLKVHLIDVSFSYRVDQENAMTNFGVGVRY